MFDGYDPKKHTIKKLRNKHYILVDKQVLRWRKYRKPKNLREDISVVARSRPLKERIEAKVKNDIEITKDELFAQDMFGASEPDFKD